MKRFLVLLVGLCISIIPLCAQIDLLTNAAQNGDLEAQIYLARIYFNGQNGVKKNYQEAYKWYLKAAEQGDAQSQYVLALGHRDGYFSSYVNAEECFKWLIKSMEQGFPPALVEMATLAQEQNEKLDMALQMLQSAANQGYPIAYAYLGDTYFYGKGVNRDYAKASEWYEKAVNKEVGLAMTLPQLGLCYSILKKDREAISCYEKGIEKEYPLAYLYMACSYAYGTGVSQNDDQAFLLLNKALSKREKGNKTILLKAGEVYLDKGKTSNATEIWNTLKNEDANFALSSNEKFCKSMRSMVNNSVDIDIEETHIKNPNTFAVIIGNENYKREVSVPFANNDANIFKEYCVKTLGIPEKNIKCLFDATYNDIKSLVSTKNR